MSAYKVCRFEGDVPFEEEDNLVQFKLENKASICPDHPTCTKPYFTRKSHIYDI